MVIVKCGEDVLSTVECLLEDHCLSVGSLHVYTIGY